MAWRAICDRCAAKRWNHELRREWQGLMVCRDTCWEARNRQDFVRGRADRQTLPWVRPEPEDILLTIYWRRTDGTVWNRADNGGWERTSVDVPDY